MTSPPLRDRTPLTYNGDQIIRPPRTLWSARLRLGWLLARHWLARGRRTWIERVMSEATTVPSTTESAPPPRKATLYLVRHGQTTYNVEHRLPGQLPGIHLNETGVRQAEELAQAIRELPLTAVVTSPLERARETAEILIQGRDVPVRLEPRLMDTDVGPWAGQLIDDLKKTTPAWNQFVQHPTVPPPGVEGFYTMLERVVAAAESARHASDLGDYVMLVAHADVIKLIVAHYLRLPIEGASWFWVPNASVTTLVFEGERDPAVAALNWTPNPAWLRPAPPPPRTDAVSESNGPATGAGEPQPS